MPDARTPHVDVHPAPFAILALALALARSRISLALALAVAGIPGADPAPSATVASTAEFPEVRVALADSGPERAPGALPAIVFVSRHADPARPAQIPGLGPHGCALITGGRLMLRDPDGRVRPLLIGDSMFDVSHPSISPDASRLAFAATRSAAGPWRIYVAGIDGGGLHAVTSGAASFDDLEPCWIDSRTLCFASTRYRQSDEYAGLPVPNLFTLDLVTGTLARLTSERNGAEAPSMDARRGTLLFSRWWFNRYRSARRGATGITLDPRAALPGDSVNLWQPMEMSAPSGRLRLAFGYPVVRLQAMGAQPVALANGGFAAVYARNMGLSPAPGGTGIWIFRSRYAPPTRLAGAAVPETATDPYSEATGLASPSACAPAALPDGRIVFALDPGARGDFGLWVSDANGDSLEPLVDLPGTLELDPAPVVAFDPAPGAISLPAAGPADESPPGSERELRARSRTFTFHDFDVFANAPPDSGIADAPPFTPGARLRFFATLSRPHAPGGDKLIRIREVPVGKHGEVLEKGLPADVPLFEQLVDAHGRTLMTAHGPSQVRGFNVGRSSAPSTCVGCHVGHSLIALTDRARAGLARSR